MNRACSRLLAITSIVLSSLFPTNTFAQCTLLKFKPSDGGFDDGFGFRVSLSAGHALVGSPRHGDGDAGAAYLFAWDSQKWTQIQEFSGAHAFGQSVALFHDVAVIGSDGKAVVYREKSGTWVLEQTLTESGATGFGHDVSCDGSQIAVGAPGVGKAFFYAWNGSSWQQTTVVGGDAGGGQFGWAVA